MPSALLWSADRLLNTPSGSCGTSGRPALAAFAGKLYCIHQGRGNSGWLWCTVYDGRSWSEDALIPDSTNAFGTSGPPALVVFNSRLYCLREGRGDSGWVWCASTSDGINWTPDQLVPDSANAFGTSGTPALAVFQGALYCAREGQGDSGWVWCSSTADGVNWTADQLLPDSANAFGTSGPPALITFAGRLWCFRQGQGNSGWLWGASTADGQTWTTDAQVPDATNPIGLSGSPALVEYEGRLYCFHEGRGNSGWIWSASSPDGVNWSGDSLTPTPDNAMGTSGSPAVCAYHSSYADDPELVCIREGRNNSGQLWVSSYSPAWMGRHYSRIRTKPLNQLCLPGSHDSGAYDLTDAVIDSAAPNPKVLDLWNLGLPAVRDGIRNFSATQSLSIAAQLDAGIRYFDFRSAKTASGDYCLAHFVIGADLTTALQNIKAFLDANPYEIVVVKSKWVGDPADRAGYVPMVQAALGSYFAPISGALIGQTVEQLVSSGQRFIFADEGACINTSSYAQQQTAADILPWLKQNWTQGPFAGQLWEVQFVALPTTQTYVLGVLAGLPIQVLALGVLTPFLVAALPMAAAVAAFKAWVAINKPPESLYDVAEALVADGLLPDYLVWASQQSPPKALNLLIADFVESSGVIEAAIALSIS